MREEIAVPRAITITAAQMQSAASTFPGDWRKRKYQRKRVRIYGQLQRAFLRKLGAKITMVPN